MDFHDIFRKFFHINPNDYRDSFFHRDENRSEGDDDDSREFCDDFENFNLHTTDIFSQMEDMFSKMFSTFDITSFPRFEEPMQPQITNPRQAMIKDTDEDFSNSALRKELVLPFSDESKKRYIGKSHSFSYSKFSSIRTVHLPDGTIEEHHTMIDNDGNKTTTVRRTIGDTSHEVTTKSDQQGIKEKEENFLNMDENELPSFDQKWDSFKKGVVLDPGAAIDPGAPSIDSEVPSIDLSESSPSLFNILKKFFGPSNKELKWV